MWDNPKKERYSTINYLKFPLVTITRKPKVSKMLPTTADKLFGVHGLVVVITGGATGIGYMMAKGLIGGGAAKVYILGDRRESLDKAAKELVCVI